MAKTLQIQREQDKENKLKQRILPSRGAQTRSRKRETRLPKLN